VPLYPTLRLAFLLLEIVVDVSVVLIRVFEETREYCDILSTTGQQMTWKYVWRADAFEWKY
jgi:hypothetical protein